MLSGVVFGGLAGMMCRVQSMPMRDMGMVGGFFVISILVVCGSFAVVSRSVLVMFSSFSVVFGSFVGHGIILFHGEMRGIRQHGRLRAAIHWNFKRVSVTT